MKIKLVDKRNRVLANIEINILVNDEPVSYMSDQDGIVEFFDANDGDKVTCYVDEKDKQTISFKEGDTVKIKVNPPPIDMVFVTIGEDEESVIGATVYFEYLEKKLEKASDNTGQIVLKGVPINTEVKVYQLANNEKVNLETNVCKSEKAQYFIVVDKSFDFTSMKFKLVDKNGQIIKGADVRFKVEGNEFESITDQDGRIVIQEIKVGNVVQCKQMIFGKSLPWHKFKCEGNIDEYILHGEKPQPFNQNSENYDSQVRMRFRLVNSKSHPIPNAVIRLDYGDKTRNKYSNQNGEAMIDDVQIGDKVIAFVDVRGAQVTSEFICQEDDEMNEIVLKTSNPKLVLWAIPVIVIIGFAIFFSKTDTFQSDDISELEMEEIEKDTIIIDHYLFQLKDSATKKPVLGSKVKLIYPDTMLEKHTNKEGVAKFKALKAKLPVKYEVTSVAHLLAKQNFTPDSLFAINLIPNDTVTLVPGVSRCDTSLSFVGSKKHFQSFKLNQNKGQFKLWLKLYTGHIVRIYKGTAENAFPENLIYDSKVAFNGTSFTPWIPFDTKDGIVTVCMKSITDQGNWVYKVYCARPVVTAVQ